MQATPNSSNESCQTPDEVRLEKEAAYVDELLELHTTDIEELTREEDRSLEWSQTRKELVTASTFGKICRVKEKSSWSNILKWTILPRQSPAIEHARKYEKEAATAFDKKYQKNCSPIGILLDEDVKFLSASPRRIIHDENAPVKIYCPYFDTKKPHPETILEALTDDNFRTCNLRNVLKTTKDDKSINLKQSHPYFYQVQGQMNIGNFDYCYFVVYLKLPSQSDIMMCKVKREKDFWETKMLPSLVEYFHSTKLPNIVAERSPNNLLSPKEEWELNENTIHLYSAAILSDNVIRSLPKFS